MKNILSTLKTRRLNHRPDEDEKTEGDKEDQEQSGGTDSGKTNTKEESDK